MTRPEYLGDGRIPTRFDHDAVVVIRTVDYGLGGVWPLIGEREFHVVRPPAGRNRDRFARARSSAACERVVGQCGHSE